MRINEEGIRREVPTPDGWEFVRRIPFTTGHWNWHFRTDASMGKDSPTESFMARDIDDLTSLLKYKKLID